MSCLLHCDNYYSNVFLNVLHKKLEYDYSISGTNTTKIQRHLNHSEQNLLKQLQTSRHPPSLDIFIVCRKVSDFFLDFDESFLDIQSLAR